MVAPHPRLRMPNGRLRAVCLVGGVLALTSACAKPTNELHPSQEQLASAMRPSLGKVLVDDQGRSVYMFVKDAADESYCTGACASVWPPVTTSSMPKLAAGLDSSKVSLLDREGGLKQVVYAGHPLYYYQADTSSNDTYGEALNQFGAEWYAVTPSGDTAEPASSSGGGYGGSGSGGTGGSSGTSGGGGNGY